MDAATRAELHALRRRAYGPAADIADDHDALRRLAQLEDLALPAAAAPHGVAEPQHPSPPPVVLHTDAAAAVESRSQRRTPVGFGRSRRWVALIVVAAGLTLVGVFTLIGAQHPSAVFEQAMPIRVPVQIDSSTGDYEDIARGDVPVFPTPSEMTWVQSLGTYYGWSVWIGGAAAGGAKDNCLLLEGPSGARARCAPADLRAQESLVIALPYDRIDPDDRPPGMTAGQHVEFVWGQGGFVTVQLRPRAQ